MEDMAVEVAKLQQRQSVSEHRISDLEGEVKDIPDSWPPPCPALTKRSAPSEKDMDELKGDIKALNARPGKWWDKIASAALGAVATGLVAAVLALILN